ncbi:GMC family oxidoreductase N-terminal domain-containing protein [soil metagenome]
MLSASNSYDVVIVGAGTAGLVVAARLTEDTSVRVLLLEAGASTAPPASVNPPEWPTLLHTTANWGGLMTVQSATGTRPLIGRGRAVGGSSAINGMLFARGHRDSYANWAAAGAKSWTFDDLLPYFKRSEAAKHGDPTLRGVDGPIAVASSDPPNEVLSALLDGAVQRGFRRADDVSGGLEIGFGPVDLTIVAGRRHSAADGYLRGALGRNNLDLVPDALVHRVVVKDGRATGVEYSTGGDTVVVAAGEVIVSAGAIGSPQVLMLSGVGPQAHLGDAGVDVVADLPGVGANLQDHPLTGVIYRAARPVSPGSRNHGEILGLIRSEAAAGGAPDIQLIFVDTAAVTGVDIPNSYLVGVSAMQPHSRGSVRLAGPAPDTLPLVNPNFFGDDRDMATMLEGFRIAREIGTAPALDSWRAEEVAPGPDADDEASLRKFIQASVSSYFHPVGTCAIGDTAQSVVDSDLRVHGISGLRVVDASVMPTLPSNNTLATVYAIAERAADLIRQG